MGLKEGALRGSLAGNNWPGQTVGRSGKEERGGWEHGYYDYGL